MNHSSCFKHIFLAHLLTGVGLATPTIAVPISYTLNLNPGTSLGQDVTNIMILESGGGLTNVDYPYSTSGVGVSVLSHDVPFMPTSSLIVGLTQGAEKPEIVMFVNNAFAQSAAGIPFSQSFPNTRHSELINRLTLAEAGDAGELNWFANTFLPGDGAAAAFSTSGPFTAMEFTSGNIIGGSISTSGNWIVTDSDFFPQGDPDAKLGLATVHIAETATDTNPFDIQIAAELEAPGQSTFFAIEKDVLNNSGVDWTDFHLQLGTGLGDTFNSQVNGSLQFRASGPPQDESLFFPTVDYQPDLLGFFGLLPQGNTASLVFSVDVNDSVDGAIDGMAVFTIRQTPSFVPEPSSFALAGFGLLALLSKRRRLT